MRCCASKQSEDPWRREMTETRSEYARARAQPAPSARLGERQVLRVDGLYMHRRLGARKQALFAGLPQMVVELGSGAGASMR